MDAGQDIIWYRQPASVWTEALPQGNGRIGTMTFGGAGEERICLNEDTLWSGIPSRSENPGAPAAFRKARREALEGRYEQAQKTLEEGFVLGSWSQLYMPLGDLVLTFAEKGETKDYTRRLDLDTGLHETAFTQNGTRFVRESFISFPDQVFAMRLCAQGDEELAFEARIAPGMQAGTLCDGQDLVLSGHCPVVKHDLYKGQGHGLHMLYGEKPEDMGVGYTLRLRAEAKDGTVTVSDSAIRISGCREAVLYASVRTSYVDWKTHPGLNGKETFNASLQDICAAQEKGYALLRERHIADFEALYDRVHFTLKDDGSAGDVPTDERLRALNKGGEDLSLYVLYFNFGRYLVISGSREGSQAMNLQGIWNKELIAPWNGNYTININTEMNYWPVMRCGLRECMEPLMRLVSEVAESGKWTAKEYYGAKGSVVHHNTDLWRMSTPVGMGVNGSACYAYWPMGLAWLCITAWEYYSVTGDRATLETKLYPAMREAAVFILDMLTEDREGHLIFAPATSPENWFISPKNGERVAVGADTAMNDGLIRELFEQLMQAEEILQPEDPLTPKVSAALSRIRPYVRNSRGGLMEWNEDFEEAEPHHRHLSPLVGLHPGTHINRDTPEEMAMVRQSLLNRGGRSTGWSMGWKINMWARLNDGEQCYELLREQLTPVEEAKEKIYHGGGTYLNLFDAHPPFQIDGNFGAASGILEMLYHAEKDGSVTLLPALPEAWKDGSLKGARLPGGKKLDLIWQDGKVLSSRISDAEA